MPRKPKVDEKGELKFKCLPTNFTKKQLEGLDEIAKLEKKNRSTVIRDAIDYYLLKHGKDQLDLHESKLVEQLKRLETGLRSLIVKNARMTGEVLYWSSLHWKDGPPKARLNQEGFNQHMERAKALSHFLLTAQPRRTLLNEKDLQDTSAGEKSD